LRLIGAQFSTLRRYTPPFLEVLALLHAAPAAQGVRLAESGVDPTVALVANTQTAHAAPCRAANREQRVGAIGVPVHHSLTRIS
jgi:hypothetical protein